MVNFSVKNSVEDKIIYTVTGDTAFDNENISEMKALEPDCILILGAGITDKDTPSPMLKDRLDAGIQIYKEGVASKILLSGDNGQQEHNEIHVMLKYAKEAGVPEEDIFCDHAGFSTYDSMYRASSIFGVERAIVVTQKYHQYRALYVGEELGLDVWGVASDQEEYAGSKLQGSQRNTGQDQRFRKGRHKVRVRLRRRSHSYKRQRYNKPWGMTGGNNEETMSIIYRGLKVLYFYYAGIRI